MIYTNRWNSPNRVGPRMALEELRSEYEEFAVELPVFPLSLTHPASHNTFPQERGLVHRASAFEGQRIALLPPLSFNVKCGIKGHRWWRQKEVLGHGERPQGDLFKAVSLVSSRDRSGQVRP